ncbi:MULTISPECIES: bacteriocin-like protein [Chryseobacterium]|uniref:bacteriocin-like protein n=1 Tax=Chryseobacterium TaxID=59732 RepID=UPI001553E029|nr:hypothetical protein [Chryseobacterium sp. LAM-KRS1]WBV58158.1 hypothetical protein PFY10_06840 [Chryseobacterium daecheongense]
MKNSKKLSKSELKRISGGNPPDCTEGIACYHRPKNGFPGYWTCNAGSSSCPED